MMVYKLKILIEIDRRSLEKQYEEFINKLDYSKVVRIDFNITSCVDSSDGFQSIYFSLAIFYEVDEDAC